MFELIRMPKVDEDESLLNHDELTGINVNKLSVYKK